jgi:hypothetical protein
LGFKEVLSNGFNIEASVFNFYFEGNQGQKQKDAVRLFEEIAKGKYEA